MHFSDGDSDGEKDAAVPDVKKEEEKVFKNKGLLSEEKIKNKREYKEARKKIKLQKKKGIL